MGDSAAETQPLYAARKKIFPKRAHGRFRTLKWWIMGVTLAIYYVTPFLRWDRGPFAPDQAVLIDLADRRFYFFFVEIWPQELFIIAGLLIMAGVGLFLITSVLGRAWCGYTCPQTVWVDLFLMVERWVEGDRNARMRLDRASLGFDKLWRRTTKHTIWLLIGLATGGAWVLYFADAPSLINDLVHFDAAYQAYVAIGVLTFTTYTFGGHMREQVCIYMCPWPRIQSAMTDENSLTVTYRDWRGEPRGKMGKPFEAPPDDVMRPRVLPDLAGGFGAGAQTGGAVDTSRRGDCVDCGLCAAVCPMGIDIRDGQQLACISCALCIDACDGVMAKVGRPQGLIAYDTLNNDKARATGEGRVRTYPWIRVRTFVYAVIWGAAGLAILAYLGLRDRLDVNVIHDRNPVAVTLSDGRIRNSFTVKILNMMPEPRSFALSVQGLDPASEVWLGRESGIVRRPGEVFPVDIGPDRLEQLRLFITVDPATLSGTATPFEIRVSDVDGSESDVYDALFESGRN